MDRRNMTFIRALFLFLLVVKTTLCAAPFPRCLTLYTFKLVNSFPSIRFIDRIIPEFPILNAS